MQVTSSSPIHKTANMVSVTAFAALISGATALGINCRGSGGCTFNDAKLSDVLTQVKQIQAQGNGGHHYAQGGRPTSVSQS